MYDQVLDLESITETVEVEYNEENATMNLVLFGDAVKHIVEFHGSS